MQFFFKLFSMYADFFLAFSFKINILKLCKSIIMSVIMFKLNGNVLAALALSDILFYANESSFAREQII
jgi:hypothetical protein